MAPRHAARRRHLGLTRLERPVCVRFEGGRASGSSGCSQFSGAYAADGDRVTLAPLAGTMMACPEPAMSVEQAFRKTFTGPMSVDVNGDRLTLNSPGGAVLAFEREPAPTLETATWEITGFNNGRQAVVSPLTSTTPTITFKGGAVGGTTGCNTFRGSYNVTGNTIAFTPIVATRKACPGDGVMLQEQQVLAAIQSGVRWATRDGQLELFRRDGERALTARLRSQ